MSTSGLTNQYNPHTLDGLTVIEADQLIIGGQEVDVDAFVPYVGANRPLDMNNQSIRTTYNAVTGSDVINLTTLTASVAYNDTANALTYLNKITATEQTVVAPTVFGSTVTSAGYYTDTAGYNFARPNPSYNAWGITRIANGGQIRDLQFKDDTANVDCLLLSNTGQTVYIGLTCNYATGSKIPIFNADRKLVSSGVDSVKITYLDNVNSDIQTQLNSKASLAGGNSFSGLQNYSDKTSDTVAIFDGSKNLSSSIISSTELNYLGGLTGAIQTQLNGKLSLLGGSMNGNISMGFNNISSLYTPINGDDLTNKTYVDGAIGGAGSLYLLKTGGTMTGDILMGANKITSTANPVNDDSLGRKGYIDSQDALRLALTGGTLTGALTVDAGVNVGTRLLGTPDGSPGNFWMGLRGTGTELQRLAISINGATTTGIVSHVAIAKLLYLSAYTANRALYLDGSQAVQASSTTATELGYLSGVTSSLQSQIDAKASSSYVDSQDAGLQGQINTITTDIPAFPRRGDLRTGAKPNDQGADSLSFYFGTYGNGTGNFADLIIMNSWADGSGGATNMIAYNKGASGIRQYQGTYGSASVFSTWYDCVMTDANSGNVGIAGQVSIGVSGNTVPNLKFSNNLNHITGNAAEAYLFNGQNGYIAIGRNTTRSATEANLHIGTAGTDASIESIASNGSVYLPLSYYASRHYFTGGNVGIKTSDPQGDLHVQLTGAVNDYWGKFIVKTTSFWGDGCSTRSETAGLQYATVFPMMFLTPHIVSDSDGWAHIRMGRSGGVSTGRWWEVSNRADGFFQIGAERSGQFIINPNGNVGIGADPAYKLDVTGDIRSSGSLLFGTGGVYESGSIFSNSDWGCLLRAKQNAPAQAHFNWRTSDGTDLMRISPSGVLNFYGGASAYAVPNGLSTTPGALVIGGISVNYNDSWNSGLLMECETTTAITIHDSGARLANFMYYNGANKFLMGKDAGWGTTAIDIQGDLYLDNPPYTASTYNIPQAGMSLGWDIYTGKVTMTPIEFYKSGPYAGALQGNWNGMNRTNQMYKGTESSCVLVSGYATAYRTSSGFQDIHIRFYNSNTFQYFTYNSYCFYNVSGNHAPIPVCINAGYLPAGWYDVYTYFITGGQATDGNDFLSLAYEIFPNGIQSS